jgi:hypothetical protein
MASRLEYRAHVVQLAGWEAFYDGQSLLEPTFQRMAAVGCMPASQLHRVARPLDLRNRAFRFYGIQARISCPCGAIGRLGSILRRSIAAGTHIPANGSGRMHASIPIAPGCTLGQPP